MNTKKKTYYHLVLDKSGSMSDCIRQTISGYNEQLQILKSLEQKYPDQEIKVGLTIFNQEVTPVASAKAPDEIAELSRENYRPSGGTALFDAIGESILGLKAKISDEISSGVATAVVVIITDGYENASRIFSRIAISRLIKELEDSGAWTFSYLGATIDAVQVAEQLNIKKENSMSFEISEISKSFEAVGEAVNKHMYDKQRNRKGDPFLKK